MAALAVAALLVLGAGVALASTPIDCAADPAVDCYGTAHPDYIEASSGVDRIYGLGDFDLIYAYGGDDHLRRPGQRYPARRRRQRPDPRQR